MAQLAGSWRRGVSAYEEILLPVTCRRMGDASCRMRTFAHMRSSAKQSEAPKNIGEHFRYRPPQSCADFLAAARAHTQQLWHPVKDRACWVDYLDSCTVNGCG